ncbi:hypothetical protein H920_15563 [Fukomys damarensis]|uniref:Secreted protein n=1 Tax=Fukomys damarensis TaxID=885580 RepID=A0A091CXS5_FUKDA|nr:hypothetical protein H920_15563 [Fukomys damarensis]
MPIQRVSCWALLSPVSLTYTPLVQEPGPRRDDLGESKLYDKSNVKKWLAVCSKGQSCMHNSHTVEGYHFTSVNISK